MKGIDIGRGHCPLTFFGRNIASYNAGIVFYITVIKTLVLEVFGTSSRRWATEQKLTSVCKREFSLRSVHIVIKINDNHEIIPEATQPVRVRETFRVYCDQDNFTYCRYRGVARKEGKVTSTHKTLAHLTCWSWKWVSLGLIGLAIYFTLTARKNVVVLWCYKQLPDC